MARFIVVNVVSFTRPMFSEAKKEKPMSDRPSDRCLTANDVATEAAITKLLEAKALLFEAYEDLVLARCHQRYIVSPIAQLIQLLIEEAKYGGNRERL